MTTRRIQYFTPRKVQEIRASGFRGRVSADDQPGLVLAFGARSETWFVRYCQAPRPGQRKVMTWYRIGVMDDFSCEAAIYRYKQVREDARRGLDPKLMDYERTQSSLARVIEDWRDSTTKDGVRSKDARLLLRIFADIGSQPARRVTEQDIMACVKAEAESHPLQADEALRRMKLVIGWARRKGYLEQDILMDVKRPKQTPRDREPSLAEMRLCYRAGLDAKDLPPALGLALAFAVLVTPRSGELKSIRAADVDFEAGTWTLRAANSKNRRTNLVLLAPPALDIIRTALGSRSRSGAFVFSPDGIKAMNGKDIRRIHLFMNDIVGEDINDHQNRLKLHDLRRGKGRVLKNAGFDDKTTHMTLNHAQPREDLLTETYFSSTGEEVPLEKELVAVFTHAAQIVSDGTGKTAAETLQDWLDPLINRREDLQSAGDRYIRSVQASRSPNAEKSHEAAE